MLQAFVADLILVSIGPVSRNMKVANADPVFKSSSSGWWIKTLSETESMVQMTVCEHSSEVNIEQTLSSWPFYKVDLS